MRIVLIDRDHEPLDQLRAGSPRTPRVPPVLVRGISLQFISELGRTLIDGIVAASFSCMASSLFPVARALIPAVQDESAHRQSPDSLLGFPITVSSFFSLLLEIGRIAKDSDR